MHSIYSTHGLSSWYPPDFSKHFNIFFSFSPQTIFLDSPHSGLLQSITFRLMGMNSSMPQRTSTFGTSRANGALHYARFISQLDQRLPTTNIWQCQVYANDLLQALFVTLKPRCPLFTNSIELLNGTHQLTLTDAACLLPELNHSLWHTAS